MSSGTRKTPGACRAHSFLQIHLLEKEMSRIILILRVQGTQYNHWIRLDFVTLDLWTIENFRWQLPIVFIVVFDNISFKRKKSSANEFRIYTSSSARSTPPTIFNSQASDLRWQWIPRPRPRHSDQPTLLSRGFKKIKVLPSYKYNKKLLIKHSTF
jgi:hypothetical protein